MDRERTAKRATNSCRARNSDLERDLERRMHDKVGVFGWPSLLSLLLSTCVTVTRTATERVSPSLDSAEGPVQLGL